MARGRRTGTSSCLARRTSAQTLRTWLGALLGGHCTMIWHDQARARDGGGTRRSGRPRARELVAPQLRHRELGGGADRRDAPAGPPLRLGFPQAAEPSSVLRRDVGASLHALPRARDAVHSGASAAGDGGRPAPARARRRAKGRARRAAAGAAGDPQGGRAMAVSLMRSDPGAVDHALSTMAETLGAYARAAVTEGADGLFYATNMATRELSTVAECRRFQRPYDLRILGGVDRAPFNVLHVCGAGILFDEFVDYPMAALSWATVPGNPALKEAHRRTGRAVIGGLPAKPEIASLPPSEVEARGRRAIAEMGSRFLALGPDCSINPDTSDAVMDAATAATR